MLSFGVRIYFSCVCASSMYRVDHSRVADVGPDRAAAEWILRLGGSVKFGSYESWTTDYNRIPAEPREQLRLEAINASGVSITNNGLEHLGEKMFLHVLLYTAAVIWYWGS